MINLNKYKLSKVYLEIIFRRIHGSSTADSSAVKSIEDILGAGKINQKSTPQNKDDGSNDDANDKNAQGMDTENHGARLRYDLGCRYLAASRFDVAEKEFRLAFKIDQTFIAPLLKLQELTEITGRDVNIPTADQEDSSADARTPADTSINSLKDVSDSSTKTTTQEQSELQHPDANATTSVTNVKNNETGNSRNRRETNDSILFTGLIIAVILVVIKLVFIDDVKN